jgi:hypothetical protein
MAVERRRRYRVAWNMEATITAGRAPQLHCTVSDLSNRGAKVTCGDTDMVPDEFVRGPGRLRRPRQPLPENRARSRRGGVSRAVCATNNRRVVGSKAAEDLAFLGGKFNLGQYGLIGEATDRAQRIDARV